MKRGEMQNSQPQTQTQSDEAYEFIDNGEGTCYIYDEETGDYIGYFADFRTNPFLNLMNWDYDDQVFEIVEGFKTWIEL
jgi:hypothetical protein